MLLHAQENFHPPDLDPVKFVETYEKKNGEDPQTNDRH